jgi:hypothetical protein
MPGQDLGLPGAHGASQAGQLKELHTVAPAVEAVQRGAGGSQTAGGVDRPQQFLALPGGRHLAETITGSQSRAQPSLAAASELLGGCQQQLADPVQRVTLAAAVAEGGLLDPSADLVDHGVGQLDGVEVVHDHPGVGKRCDQGAGVATPWVQGDRADPGQPVPGPGRRASRPPRPWCGRPPGPAAGHPPDPLGQ